MGYFKQFASRQRAQRGRFLHCSLFDSSRTPPRMANTPLDCRHE
jgi:hypothetical protein